jgi:hypothetical protein
MIAPIPTRPFLVRWRDAHGAPKAQHTDTAEGAVQLAYETRGVAYDLHAAAKLADYRPGADAPGPDWQTRLLRGTAVGGLAVGGVALLVSAVGLAMRPRGPLAGELWGAVLMSLCLLALAWLCDVGADALEGGR